MAQTPPNPQNPQHHQNHKIHNTTNTNHPQQPTSMARWRRNQGPEQSHFVCNQGQDGSISEECEGHLRVDKGGPKPLMPPI
uniref:Uncharacterized protein n=1 Tax=Fagus sylvatica TaxID=28930 RepID=A0A2N9GBB8_FAGSY